MTDELEWIERQRTTTYEYMWRDHATGLHYEAENPRGGLDVATMVRTITVDKGTVLGMHPELGQVHVSSDDAPKTNVELPPVESAWRKV
ncbi:hypothetical protein [Paramicrobacterium agarici]|uniref:hypothetical protein n=1 Tax=Paramicrobacterium agarici TaxID=630514 RepID=UPI001150DAB7|nr:hypothetical protein [Microbacterium agarici]TQO23801.1 hypothetical protein FB385_2663 [Microbacterium agarici]